MKKNRLLELANLLIDKIKSQEDCFSTITVVFPNVFIEQWFKTYWLKTQKNDVMMNVEFKQLNDILPELVTKSNYKLIKKNSLTQVIVSILARNDEELIPKKYIEYYKNNPVKLYDFSSSLAQLYLDYYKDNFFDFNGWEKKLYDEIVFVCSKYRFGTIEKPVSKGKNDKKIYLFGINKVDKVYRELIDNCDFIEEYNLELDETYDVDYTIINAPSKVREIEYIHSEICKLLNNGANVSDFLVVAPNIGEYSNEIERVFRQNDIEYPSIPFVIRHHKIVDSDVIKGIKLLFKIYKNKFFTRLDLYNLVSNSIVKKVRNIKDDEIEVWMKSIISLNIHRDHPYLDDRVYLKKRLLLSKLSSVNFSDDNLVSLKESDYLPYTNINFDDDLILKLIKIIDDLNDFISLLKNEKYINNDLVDKIKEQFDRWFLTNDEIDNNKQYNKILYSIDSIKELKNDLIPLDTFFFILFDSAISNSIQTGNAFTQGITFIDFDINSIVSQKYIFFIGASSNNIPSILIKNELDLRDEIDNNDEQLGLFLLYQNVLEKLYISYVFKDLKNEEEFYISPLIIVLNKRNKKYIEKNIKYPSIPLDETRNYSELFTRKEFNDKVYFDHLLNNEIESIKEEKKENEEIVETIFYESVSVKEMANYLIEPLSSKANNLFNRDNDIQEKIKDEWEAFTPDALIKSIITNKILFEMVSKTFDYDKLLTTFRLNNNIPTVNKEYEKKIYDDAIDSSKATIDMINNITNNDYSVIEPYRIKLVNSDNREWMLTSSDSICLHVEGNNRIYLELKDMSKSIHIKDFIALYIMALMDIVNLNDEKNYHVILAKGEDVNIKKEKYKDRDQWEFDIDYKRANELLNNIHDALGNYNHNALVNINWRVDQKIDSFEKLKEKVLGNNGGAAWSFFPHKNIFNPEKDFGYNPNKFETKDWIKELNSQVKLIKFLDKVVLEEDDTDGK